MASEGPNSPGTMADDDAVGTKAWADVNNAKASDGAYASVQVADWSEDTSHYLKATNFSFSIPSGATIDGIYVEIERYPSVGETVIDYEVKIVKADATVGTENKASASAWSATEDYYIYGANNDLWSESWDDTDINHANFGVVLSAKANGFQQNAWAYVDHIRITVYYTAAASGTNMTINVDDTMKEVATAYVQVDDAWKEVASASVNVDDAWKTIF